MIILKNITNIITGHVFRSKVLYSHNGNIKLLNMDSISTTGSVFLSSDDTKNIIAKDLKQDEILKSGDILFKAKGLNNNAVLIKNIPENTTVTSSCHIIRITDDKFLPEYVCAWLNSSIAKKHFSKGAGQATGITIANVSKATLETLEIPQISLGEQKLIASINEYTKLEKELYLKIAEKKYLLNHAIIERKLRKLGDK